MKNNLVIILLLATFMGLAAGIAGELFSRAYLAEKIYRIPMFGELNFNAADYNKSNIVISNPKKVVVEQGERVANVAESSISGLAKIYNRKGESKSSSTAAFSITDHYSAADEVAQGYVVTADGWIISRYFPEEKAGDDMKAAASSSPERLKGKYVVEISGKLYELDAYTRDASGKYSYWRVKAQDLPVQAVLGSGSVRNGDQILLINRYGQVWVTNIYGKSSDNGKVIKSSDTVFVDGYINTRPPDNFINSFVFSMNGAFMGILDDKKNTVLFENPADIIYNLTKTGKFKSMKLGVNYADLSALTEGVKKKPNEKGAIILKDEKGVAVEKGSVAEKAGLKEGDIILKIDNAEIGKTDTLKSVLAGKRTGEKANITYLRVGQEKTVEVLF